MRDFINWLKVVHWIEEKASEEMKERKLFDYIDSQKNGIEKLQVKLHDCKSILEEYEKDTEFLQNLYLSGFIDIDDNLSKGNSHLSLFLYSSIYDIFNCL